VVHHRSLFHCPRQLCHWLLLVVPAEEAINTNNANAEMASLGTTVGSGRGDVVDIIGVFALHDKFSAILILPLTYR
jgi:hypothetical protein